MSLPELSPLPTISYTHINNTKLFQIIMSNQIPLDGKFHDVNVFKDVFIRIALRNSEKKEFCFEPIDALIFDAICTLHTNKIHKFTVDTVAMIMYHDTHHRLRSEQILKINNRIQAMSKLRIRLDITNELLVRNIVLDNDRLLKRNHFYQFITLKEIDVVFTANRKQGRAYHVPLMPPLWEYTTAIEQVILCPWGLFNLDKHRINEESLLIMRYIQKRVAEMKNKNNHQRSRKISLLWEDSNRHGLLVACNIDPDKYKNWNDKHRKICNFAELFLLQLQNWPDRQFRIYGFTPYKSQGSFKTSGYIIKTKK